MSFVSYSVNPLRCVILPIFNPNALPSPLSAAVAAFYIVESHGRHEKRPRRTRCYRGPKEKVQ